MVMEAVHIRAIKDDEKRQKEYEDEQKRQEFKSDKSELEQFR